MDAEALSRGLILFNTAFTLIQKVLSILPDGREKAQAQAALDQAEAEFKIAEVKYGQTLGHEVCYAHWPSGIMLSSDRRIWECPICHSTRDTTIRRQENPNKKYRSVL